jgi:AraC family transcriptional regulator
MTGVTVVLAGDIRESTRLGEEIGTALSIVVKPAGVRHADEIGPHGARTLQVAFAPDGPRAMTDRTALGRWRWVHTGPASVTMLALARSVRRAPARRGARVGTEDLEEHILDAIVALTPDVPTRPSPPSWLARVKEALDDQITSGIAVADLARLVGTHPVTVSRAFREHYGIPLTEYRRRERVRRAAARIGGSSQSLSRIAHQSGHADHPHLCREFRRLTGLRPSEYRRLIASA